MNVSKIGLGLLLFLSLANAEQFDYHEFMDSIEKQKQIEERSFFDFNWFSSNDEADEDATYSQKKYGRTLKYQTYEEIKADRKKRNTLLMVGAEYRKLRIYEKEFEFNELGQPIGILDIHETKDEEYNPTIYMSTLLDLKYFNIQEEKRNTYLGVGIGKYIDIDLQWDFLDGRTTE